MSEAMIATIHPNCLNEVMNCHMNRMPVAGMLGTKCVGSDRYPVVCAKVLSTKRVMVLDVDENCHKNVIDGVEYYDGDIEALIKQATPKIEAIRAHYHSVSEEEIQAMFDYESRHFKSGTTYSLRDNGRWLSTGVGKWNTGSVNWGVAEFYLDPSF